MANIEKDNVLKIRLIRDNAVVPKRQTEGAAGYDLHAAINEEITIQKGDMTVIPTGICAEIPEGMAGMIFTRSGLGVKHGLVVANGVGVIDSDYRGEIHVALRNNGKESYTVVPGDRIAQLIIMPVVILPVEECDFLEDTQRGNGGFGSTGKR